MEETSSVTPLDSAQNEFVVIPFEKEDNFIFVKLSRNADDDQINLENTRLWNDYLQIKEHFPGSSISTNKEAFFRKLAPLLSSGDQPGIQSYDGSTIDVLWEGLTVSLTASDALSVSTKSDFEYFEDCLADPCIDYIVRQRTNTT